MTQLGSTSTRMAQGDSSSDAAVEDFDPVAGLSSAAACISIVFPANYYRLNTNPTSVTSSSSPSFTCDYFRFSPVFTHQSFDEERIRGYEPTGEAIQRSVQQAQRLRDKFNTSELSQTQPMATPSSLLGWEEDSSRTKIHRRTEGRRSHISSSSSHSDTPNSSSSSFPFDVIPPFRLPHSSFRHHPMATHQLIVSIQLAPSWKQCMVHIITQRKNMSHMTPTYRATPSPYSPLQQLQVKTSDDKKGFKTVTEIRRTKKATVAKSIETRSKRPIREKDDASQDPPKKRRYSSNTEKKKETINHSSLSTSISSSSSLYSSTTSLHSTSSSSISISSSSYTVSTTSFRSSSPSSASSSSSNIVSDTGPTRRRRMDIDEILLRISKALPTIRHCSHTHVVEDDIQNYYRQHFVFLGHSDTSTVTVSTITTGNSEKTHNVRNKKDKKYIQKLANKIDNDYLEEVLGTVVHEYTRPIQKVDPLDCSLVHPSSTSSSHWEDTNHSSTIMGDFILTLADGSNSNVKEYHEQVQKVSLWFIENADGVDVSSTEDNSSGRWQVLYLFRKHTVDSTSSSRSKNPFKYSLVGYMTLYSFSSPFKKPKGGTVQRICQVVILPPYQRAGHGKMMLQTVYRLAASSCSTINTINFERIVEINVEDPAPAFVGLRDSVDYQLIKENCDAVMKDSSNVRHGSDRNGLIRKSEVSPIIPLKYLSLDFMEPLPNSDVTTAAAIARITPQQLQIAYEMYKLDALMKLLSDRNAQGAPQSDEEADEMERKYSLMVKKRLNVSHKEEISMGINKEEKKTILTRLYNDTLKHYQLILGQTTDKTLSLEYHPSKNYYAAERIPTKAQLVRSFLKKEKDQRNGNLGDAVSTMTTCNHDHYLDGVYYRPCFDPSYCGVGYYLHGINCADCGIVFHDKMLSEGKRKFKPSCLKPVYACVNATKYLENEDRYFCSQALCFDCFQGKTINMPKSSRNRCSN